MIMRYSIWHGMFSLDISCLILKLSVDVVVCKSHDFDSNTKSFIESEGNITIDGYKSQLRPRFFHYILIGSFQMPFIHAFYSQALKTKIQSTK